jgi:DNA-binding transcriptional MerR regulator
VNAHRSTQRFTLQQLAAAAGMTVRNVRSYQTRGLIPPPTRAGRQSIYTAEHLDRLTEIRQARSRGATLGLIGSRLAQGGSLDADGVDHTWLPRLAHRSGTGRGERSSTGRAASMDGLLSRASTPSSAVESAVADLVDAGVLRRNGQHVVADRSLATGVGNLAKRGLPVERVLGVAVTAAEAGRTLGAAVEAALAELGDDDRARMELLEVVAGVLGIVVTLDITDPLPTQRASTR